MFAYTGLEGIIARLIGLVLAFTFHEWAHAKSADVMGDPTPRSMGRLTLNPLAHVDPIGLLLLFLAGFGWAKPVPVNPYNFADPRRGMVLVAAAGPLSNVVLAYLTLVLLRVPGFAAVAGGTLVGPALEAFYQFNLVLAVFNLLPIPPLDGSKILAGLLPGRSGSLYALEQYGPMILILLVFTRVIGRILGPLIRGLHGLLEALVGALGGMAW
ncbi:MAG TPA: site-2 protease family protein [Bacillota bacterium]